MPRGFTTFFDDILQHHFVRREIGYEALQLGVLVPGLLQLARLTRLEIAVDLPPPVNRLLRDPHLATALTDRDARAPLLQDRRDLFDRKPFPLHRKPPFA